MGGILNQVGNNQIEGILGEVYAWTRDQELVNIPFEHLEASRGKNYPHDCRSLALSKVPELKSKAIQKLDLVLSIIWELLSCDPAQGQHRQIGRWWC